MKKLLAFAFALAIGAGSMSAQFTTGGKASSGMNRGGNSADSEAYNMFAASYAFNHYWFSAPSGYITSNPFTANGGALTYLHGFSISEKYPMFIETGGYLFFGAGTQKVEWEDEYYIYEAKQAYLMANLAIPVNFAYRFNVAQFFDIKPYLGLNAKINLLGKTYAVGDSGDSASMYSKDDMGDFAWNRFQLGWHLGVDFEIAKVVIGLEYGTDFIPAMSYEKFKTHSSTFNLRFGYLF